MPSALWTYYDCELCPAARAAAAARDVERVARVLARVSCFEQLVMLQDDEESRLREVRRCVEHLRRRVVELTIAGVARGEE